MVEEGDNAGFAALADEGVIECRSFELNGKTRNLRVEASYWRALEEISQREQMSLQELLVDIHYRLLEQTPQRARKTVTVVMIANAIRVFVVGYYRHAATEQGHDRAGHGRGALSSQPADAPSPCVFCPTRNIPLHAARTGAAEPAVRRHH